VRKRYKEAKGKRGDLGKEVFLLLIMRLSTAPIPKILEIHLGSRATAEKRKKIRRKRECLSLHKSGPGPGRGVESSRDPTL